MIDLDVLLRFGLALAAVLGLIGLLAWVAKMRLDSGTIAALGKRRVAIIESASLDGRTRLVLVRRDGCEHLLAVGPAGVTAIETGVTPPSPGAAP